MLLLVRGTDQGQPQLRELADTGGQGSSIHKDLKTQLWTRSCLETTEQNTEACEVGLSAVWSPVPQEKQWPLCLVPFLCFPSFLSSYPTFVDPMPARLLCPWNSSGKDTRVDCHFLLQGIFLTQDQTQFSCIAGIFFTVWANREASYGGNSFPTS